MPLGVGGLGFRVWGFGGLGFRVWGLRIQGAGVSFEGVEMEA